MERSEDVVGRRSKLYAAVAVGLLLVCGCHRGGDGDEDEQPAASHVDAKGQVVLSRAEREAVGVETAAARDGALTTVALRFGKVVARPQEDAFVVAPVTSRLVAAVSSLGARVSRGDPLVAIEPLVGTASRANLEAQRRELLGRLQASRAQLHADRSELARVTTLVATGLATKAAQAQASATLEAEQARSESLRRAASELGRATGGRTELGSPIAGVVATLDTDEGSLVTQGAVVARVVGAGPRWIDLEVPPGDPVGDAYRVRGASGLVPARMLTRGSIVGPDGFRRDRLLANADASSGLMPGATVPVQVLHRARGIVVPSRAIVHRGREELVFVQVAEGRYAPKTVRVGARDAKRTVVTSGLALGDRVVRQGVAALLGALGEAAAAAAVIPEHEAHE